jgi:parvulin-like peptidyl-prolyl isomerase
VSRQPGTRTPPARPPQTAAPRPAPRATTAHSAMTRHQLSRHEKEQHYQRLTLIGGAVIIVVVLALLGVGWYQSYVRPLNQTVITVGSMKADMRYYIKRVKQLLPTFGNSDPQTILALVPQSAEDQIEQEFTVLQAAPKMGITASEADIDQAIRDQLGILTPNGQAPDRGSLAAALRSKLAQSGLTIPEYRQEIRAQVLRDRVQAKLGADYPKTGPAAKYQLIVANDEADANGLIARFNSGDSWESVAATVGANPSLGSVPPALDFQPKALTDEKLADALFALNPGEHTGVISTGDGKFTIARLIEKDPQHQITDDQVKTLTPRLFSSWLDDQKKALKVKENLSDEQKLSAVLQSGWQPPKDSGQQGQPGQAAPPAVPGQQQLPPGISTPPGGLVPPAQPPGGAAPPAQPAGAGTTPP